MKKQLLPIILCGFALGLSACTAPNAMRTQTDPATGASNVKTMTSNPVLATRIGVNRVNMTTLGDIKKASLALKNGWFYAQSFEYKIVWVDASGFEVNPEGSRWKPIQLTGREIKTVQSIAPNPSAVDIVVYLRKD